MSMRKYGELYGMTVLHIDDFLVAGSPDFLKQNSEQFKRRFMFGRTQFTKIRFTG